MQDEKPNEQKRQYARQYEYINDNTQDEKNTHIYNIYQCKTIRKTIRKKYANNQRYIYKFS